MTAPATLGTMFYCHVCGAELTVIGAGGGDLCPRCCNRAMVPLKRRAAIYACPVCGAELARIRPAGADFHPRCCNREMVRKAA